MTDQIALLREAGEALYGDLWQSAVARDLGVADRSVRRWIAGVHGIPPGIWGELSGIMQERADNLAAVRKRLPR
jgi:hypothetical protein